MIHDSRTASARPSSVPATTWATATACTFGLALAACSSLGSSGPDTGGELGNGTFRYTCTGVDPTCGAVPGGTFDPTNPRAPVAGATFPTSFALGATFRLDFVASVTTTARVTPASGSFFSSANQVFTSLRPGTSALVATATSNGRVVDFTHVVVSVPKSLRILAHDGVANRVRAPGSSTVFGAIGVSGTGEFLAGSIVPTWQVSDPSIARLEDSPGHEVPPERAISAVTLAARSPGVVKIFARYAGREESIDVTIGDFAGDAGANDGGDAGASQDASKDAARDAGADATASDAGSTTDGGTDGS
ncbi:MAG: hypothetical protein U0169_09145 [Polyangiaceae bacterium]